MVKGDAKGRKDTIMQNYDVVWSPEGRTIATFAAPDMATAGRLAKRHTPKPYRTRMGEVYVKLSEQPYTAYDATGYTVRRQGDNYALCHNGQMVESGLFALRATADKHKAIAENERRERLAGRGRG